MFFAVLYAPKSDDCAQRKKKRKQKITDYKR